jgi:transcriptional regulator with XRE-family HTH domain
VVRTKEGERFAAQIRALKDRAGISFEELARRTGISSSSLHRYCSGTKIPTGYGVIHTFAKACGASNEELRETHRLWALADAERSSSTVSDEKPTSVIDNEHATVSSAPPADPPAPRQDPRRRTLTFAAVTVAVLTVTAAGVIGLLTAADRPDTSAVTGTRPDSGPTAPVRVFNVEKACRNRSERLPGCSIGLAANPRVNYDAHNVVNHRVWHGDVVNADCILYDSDEVTDETGTGSTRWFRVHTGDVPGGRAWLSGIRTRDNPALPTCVPGR